MLTYLLNSPGREVTTASGVAQARERMAQTRFDLYVLDLRVGGGSGEALCREIVRGDPWAKVVFYSGWAYEEHRDAALAAGAADYVTKPDIKGLAEAVERLLPSRAARREA